MSKVKPKLVVSVVVLDVAVAVREISLEHAVRDRHAFYYTCTL